MKKSTGSQKVLLVPEAEFHFQFPFFKFKLDYFYIDIREINSNF